MKPKKRNLFLLLTALVLTLMLILPMAIVKVNAIDTSIYTWGYMEKWDSGEFVSIRFRYFISLLIINIAIVVICLIVAFLNFKQDVYRKNIVVFIIVAIIGFSFLCNFYVHRIPMNIENISLDIGGYLPPLAIVFCICNIVGIYREIN